MIRTLMLFGVGVSCRILYFIVCYLHISCSGSITSVAEKIANLSAITYMLLCCFCLERFPLPLVLGMGCVILFWHSQGLPYNYFEYCTSNRFVIFTKHNRRFFIFKIIWYRRFNCINSKYTT